MNAGNCLKVAALALILAGAGCKSAAEKANQAALSQAMVQALATGVPQKVVYTDKDGNTVTKIVQPPAPGESVEKVTTIRTRSPEAVHGQRTAD